MLRSLGSLHSPFSGSRSGLARTQRSCKILGSRRGCSNRLLEGLCRPTAAQVSECPRHPLPALLVRPIRNRHRGHLRHFELIHSDGVSSTQNMVLAQQLGLLVLPVLVVVEAFSGEFLRPV